MTAMLDRNTKIVIPAQAGIHFSAARAFWGSHDHRSAADTSAPRNTVDPGLRRDDK
jgi:hypothetical protein